jgi:hypothetical protein
MFTHNTIIDSIQNGKKQIVNTFVQDAKFKAELNKLIDAQAAAAKTSVEASLAIAQALTKQATDAFKACVPAYTK